MKLNPTPPDPRTGFFCRLESEDGKIEMGVFKVAFGHRVRAGWVGNGGCELDWCGGGNWKDVERLYSICKAILLKRDTTAPFAGLPGHSEIKPFFLDHDFTMRIIEAAGDCEPITLDRFAATIH